MTISGGPYRWNTEGARESELSVLRDHCANQSSQIAKLTEANIALERQIRRLRGYMAALSSGSFV